MTGPRPICRRSTDDPLLRLFIDRYHLHLLAAPRQGSAVGDLYIERNGVVGTPGYVGEVLSQGFELPELRTGERLADITGQLTRGASAKTGARVAEQLLGGLGIPASAGISAAISRTGSVRFRFHDVFRASVDVLALGRALSQHTLIAGHPAILDRAKYYVATSVLTSDAISVLVDGGSGIDLDGQAGGSLVGVDACVIARGANEIQVQSAVPLAFAVELYELQFNTASGMAQLRRTPVAIRVRGQQRTVTRERPVPAEIGSADGDLFLASGG